MREHFSLALSNDVPGQEYSKRWASEDLFGRFAVDEETMVFHSRDFLTRQAGDMEGGQGRCSSGKPAEIFYKNSSLHELRYRRQHAIHIKYGAICP